MFRHAMVPPEFSNRISSPIDVQFRSREHIEQILWISKGPVRGNWEAATLPMQSLSKNMTIRQDMSA
ncbi:hypothetical protein [Kitasatospora cheerisanensis]|uniref:hypothetical protein n=1 Tax=Kitasatospora cheerisanensis TaxID=81942 RepID=UPI0012EE78F8|nr:hypothetical protein [Kitasatospora cheerisanensis]